MVVDLILFLVGWGAGWWLLWRVPLPPDVDPEAALRRPPVSVIVPARDEEAVLPVLLASLGPELRSDDELIVVDDHSGDATALLARAAGATVVSAPPLPAGWTGKAWACHNGAARATRATVIFLDADTRLDPGGLGRLIAGLAAAGGLYSLQPWHEVVRPHERLAAVFNVVAMMGTTAFAPGRDGRAAVGAFGPCLVTSAADYHRAGGHESVRNTVLDDLALADRYHAAALPVTIHGGKGTIGFRMYPLGLGQLVEGFTKNFAVAARAVGLGTAALITLWLAALSAPVVLATIAPVPAAICYAAAAVQMAAHLRRLGSFGALTAALYPLAVAVFVAVFARSVIATLVLGRVRWKGRDVATRRRPPRAS
ncbi:MAG TPA: glycosyltransferase family 2 protein [Acidimicrobiales bacterium]|nr:glycosyltransferase family 2 protein [Acidimicrobiales bacterium]